MSQHKLTGQEIVLMVSRDGGVTYPYIVCLTSVTVNRETNEIDASSFCGPDTLKGAKKNGVVFEGQIMEDPTTGTFSTDDLIDMWETGQTINWKVGKPVPLIGDETDIGTGWFSKLTKTFANNAVATFSGALGVYGTMTRTTATS